MIEILHWLIAMIGLLFASAFFSASEAALFSLQAKDLRELRDGRPGQQAAYLLMARPERLLSAVLFWNLLVNVCYFAIASILEQHLHSSSSARWALRVSSLVAIIFFSEMLPKCLGVMISKQLSSAVSLPLTLAVRVLDPIMPALQTVNLLSRRLLWPRFQAERYLEVADLERAIELSTSDQHILEQEQTILRNIVSLSELRVEEAMRPRPKLRTFRPPVSIGDLGGEMTPSGYLLITDADSDEIDSAVNLNQLTQLPDDHLERYAEPVVFVPWCASVAHTLHLLRSKEREVAVVVNEMGEAIGVLTLSDLWDVVFTNRSSRSERLLNREPIQLIHHGLWQATLLTNLRQLADYFDVELPPSTSSTIAGVFHECLQRMPELGDRCEWGPFRLEVLESQASAEALVHIERLPEEAPS